MDDFPPEVVMRILGLLDPWWVGVASQVSQVQICSQLSHDRGF